MPTYSYACTACEHRFDTVQAFTDSSLTDCPECAGRLRKLFSSVGIVFKGSGFYRNDSRSAPASSGDGESGTSDQKSDQKSDAKSEQTSDTKSEQKSETKPDKKSDTKSGSSGSAGKSAPSTPTAAAS